MELKNHHKITFWILGLLIIGAISSSIPKAINFIKHKQQGKPSYAIRMNLKSEFPYIAKKYNLYPDIFEQDGPVLIYGYIPGQLNSEQSEVFDKKFKKLLGKENLQHKINSYKNWNTIVDVIQEKYVDNEVTCTMVTKEQEKLEDYLSFINKCMTQACIVDTQTNKYVVLSRNEDYIIETLKGNLETEK
jgi:hypothetical protein